VSPRIDATEPLSLELADFGGAICGERALVSSPQVGLDVVHTVEAVDRSLVEGGRPVEVGVARQPLEHTLRIRLEEVAADDGPAADADSADGKSNVGTAILGGGPAGLTAAYVIGGRHRPGAVFEADGTVGGIAKTIEFNGYRFDLGGHRFFTKLKPVQRLWEEVLGDEFLTRPRLSRIYYDGKFFDYPITAKDVVARLGLVEATRCALSYLWGVRHRKDDAETFEDWVTTRFGRR